MEENLVTPADSYSPLALAFLGDAVFEIYVREHILALANSSVDSLHRKAVKFVKASAQCEIYDAMEYLLTEKEIKIFKRGRNAKSNSKAKSSTVAEYKKATGFETLLGYLHINKQFDRIKYLLDNSIKFE